MTVKPAEFLARIRVEYQALFNKEPMRAKLADIRTMARCFRVLGLSLSEAPPYKVCQYAFDRNEAITYGIPRPFCDSSRGALIWVLNRYLEKNEPSKSHRHRSPLGLE